MIALIVTGVICLSLIEPTEPLEEVITGAATSTLLVLEMIVPEEAVSELLSVATSKDLVTEPTVDVTMEPDRDLSKLEYRVGIKAAIATAVTGIEEDFVKVPEVDVITKGVIIPPILLLSIPIELDVDVPNTGFIIFE